MSVQETSEIGRLTATKSTRYAAAFGCSICSVGIWSITTRATFLTFQRSYLDPPRNNKRGNGG